jgi:subfamily B ATP-binding cassette protein MsbA
MNDKPHPHIPVKRIWQLIEPYTVRVIIAVIFSLVVTGMNGLIAWLVKPAMDHIFIEKQYEFLIYLPAGVLFIYVVKGAADFVQIYLMRTAGLRLVRDMRNEFFAELSALPISSIAKTKSSDFVSRQLNDISMLSQILSESFRTFLVEIPTAIVLIGVAVYRRWDLTLFSFLLLPVVAVGTRKISVYVRKKRKEVQRYAAILTHRINELVTGIKIVKIFGLEEIKIKQFKGENQKNYRHSAGVIYLKEVTRYMFDIMTGISIAVILWYGSKLVVTGVMTAGDFFSIITAIILIFNPVKKIGNAYTVYQESLGVLERVDGVMSLESEKSGEKKIDGLKKYIKFKAVSYSYKDEEEPVLQDIDFQINKGEVVAFVGPSGAGKSTIIDLMSRFIDPQNGEVCWDDMPFKEVDLKSLRQNIAVVSQDVILFSDTIRDNILYGRPDASLEEVEESCKVANAHDFIMQMPQKYDTMLSERGLNLSGGQRQRVAIARAVLKNPPLLILDEATSALDNISEKLVQDAINNIMKGRTTIIIAHRLTTIQNADRIFLFDKGRIIAAGSHENLLESSNLYAELYLTSNEGEKNEKTRI